MALEAHIKVVTVFGFEKRPQVFDDIYMGWRNIYYNYYPIILVSTSVLFTYLMKLK